MQKIICKVVICFIILLGSQSIFAKSAHHTKSTDNSNPASTSILSDKTEKSCTSNCWLHRVNVMVNYLRWKIKDSPQLLPLVESGTLTNPATSVVLGGDRISNSWRNGAQFALQYWGNDAHTWGAEANYFFLANKSTRQTVQADGSLASAFLTTPFYDVTIPGNNFFIIAFPNNFSGTATLETSNKMQGAELNGLFPIYSNNNLHLILIGGFRYLNFDDQLQFTTSSPFINTTDVFITRNSFQARNNFYGPQLGIAVNYDTNGIFAKIKAQLALGAMHNKAIIEGSLDTSDYTGFTTIQHFSGGYFALPSNIGEYAQTKFAAIPMVDFKLGYHVTKNFSLLVGYSFLYATHVLWAANEMSNTINPTQSVAISDNPNATLVGDAQPQAQLKTQGFWVQGITAGFTLRF